MTENLKNALEKLHQSGLTRFLRTVEGEQGPEILYQGKTYLNFSSNNYLGLANHPLLKEASIEAVRKYGTGSSASRLITGSMTLHEELERVIARFKGTEAALLFNSGYHANIGLIPSLMGEGGLIFSDELNHASLIDGCRLSKAKTFVYRHNNTEHLEELFRRGDPLWSPINGQAQGPAPMRLIVTDTVFSMDGDLCPLPRIMEFAEKYKASVLVDEAHATGVFGKKGRGVVEHFGIPSDHPRLIQMGTLGKALGSFGAYVCGSRELINYLINKARSFIYTTALPPAVVAASLAALHLVQDDLSLKERLWKNVNYFGAQSPVVPIIIGGASKTMEVAQQLFEKGIWAQPIRPPTVPEGTSRIRLTIMATHTKEHLDRCLEALKNV